MKNFQKNSVDIPAALACLEAGGLVAIPTETVYGLAAMAHIEAAILAVFSRKQRPSFDPLIVHIADEAQVKKCSRDWNLAAQSLAEAFWPGPLTIISPKSDLVPDVITAGLDTVGLRMPDHSLTQELIAKCEIGLAAPSANPFGATSPTSPEHVYDYFPEIPILDGGVCTVGIESTVVWPRVHSGKAIIDILRPGAVTAEQMQQILSQKGWDSEFRTGNAQKGRSPGQALRHYAPAKTFVLVEVKSADPAAQPEIERALSQVYGISAGKWRELKLSSDPYIAARHLYRDLIELSSDPVVDGIFILRDDSRRNRSWEAIWDRIERAKDAVYGHMEPG